MTMPGDRPTSSFDILARRFGAVHDPRKKTEALLTKLQVQTNALQRRRAEVGERREEELHPLRIKALEAKTQLTEAQGIRQLAEAATAGMATPSQVSSLRKFIIGQYDKAHPDDPYVGRSDQVGELRGVATGISPAFGMRLAQIFPDIGAPTTAPAPAPAAPEVVTPAAAPAVTPAEAPPISFPEEGFLAGAPEAPPAAPVSPANIVYHMGYDEQVGEWSKETGRPYTPGATLTAPDKMRFKSWFNAKKELAEQERTTGREEEELARESLEAEVNSFLASASGGKLSRGEVRIQGVDLTRRWGELFGAKRDLVNEAQLVFARSQEQLDRAERYREISGQVYKLYQKALGDKRKRAKPKGVVADYLNEATGDVKIQRFKSGDYVTPDEIKKLMDSYKLRTFPESKGSWLEPTKGKKRRGKRKGKGRKAPAAVAVPTAPTAPRAQINQSEWKMPEGRKRIIQQLGLVDAQISTIDEAFKVGQ